MRSFALEIALANTQGMVKPEQIIEFLENSGEDLDIYTRVPPPPGMMTAAAIDFVAIFNTVASAASVASLLWQAYDRFIAPKKNQNDSSGLFLRIRRDDGTSEQFWIGNLQKDQQVFVGEFSRKVEEIRESSAQGMSTDRVIEELRCSGAWVSRK